MFRYRFSEAILITDNLMRTIHIPMTSTFSVSIVNVLYLKDTINLNYSTVQKKCKRNLPRSAKLREFRQSNFELSCQTKMRQNFGSSIVLMPAKFRGMRRNFVAKFRAGRTKFRVIRRKFRFDEVKFRFGETKYRFDETKFRSFRWGEISSAGRKFCL